MQTRIGHNLVQQWIVGLIFAAALGCVTAQTQGSGKQFSTSAELLTLAADPKTHFDTVQVSRFLATLPTGERQALDHQLIALPHEELIVGVLLRVLRDHDEGAVGLIASHISSWK